LVNYAGLTRLRRTVHALTSSVLAREKKWYGGELQRADSKGREGEGHALLSFQGSQRIHEGGDLDRTKGSEIITISFVPEGKRKRRKRERKLVFQ